MYFETGKNILLIINPNSGTLKIRNSLVDVIDLMNKNGKTVTVATTQGVGDAKRIVLENSDKYDQIICAGGDGTFNEVVSGIMEAEVKPLIGYIPAGTTNDFASSMKIPPVIIQATKNSIAGAVKEFDVGQFNSRYFSYVASFGAFTETSYLTPQSRKNILGHLAYILEGMNNISSIKPYKIKLESKEKTIEDEFIFGAICNSTSLGGLIKLDAKYVDMNDGYFEVLLVKKPDNATELQKMISGLITQQFDGKVITLFSTSNLKITTEEVFPWSLDGEYEHGAREINIKNHHSALKIVL